MTDSVGRDFMRQTWYDALDLPAQERGVPQPPVEHLYNTTEPHISLPIFRDVTLAEADLREVIAQRVTVRRYAPEPVTQAELSYLLWSTQGVKPIRVPGRTLRTVPSAGARHPFETLLLVNRVEGLAPGLYHYVASEHALAPLRLDDAGLAAKMARVCEDQPQFESCAVAFIWVAVPERTTWRYSARGYRYMHLDAGHVCQNLYLAAWSIGCGTCAIGAFYDEALNKLLELDGENQFVIYMGTVGRRPGA